MRTPHARRRSPGRPPLTRHSAARPMPATTSRRHRNNRYKRKDKRAISLAYARHDRGNLRPARGVQSGRGVYEAWNSRRFVITGNPSTPARSSASGSCAPGADRTGSTPRDRDRAPDRSRLGAARQDDTSGHGMDAVGGARQRSRGNTSRQRPVWRCARATLGPLQGRPSRFARPGYAPVRDASTDAGTPVDFEHAPIGNPRMFNRRVRR